MSSGKWNQSYVMSAPQYPGVKTVEMWGAAKGTARLYGRTESNNDSQLNLRGIPLPSLTYAPQLRAGRWLEPGDDYAVVLNLEVAQEMGIGVGDRISINLPTRRESNWLVVGLLFEPLDQAAALVPQETLLKEIGQVGRAKAIKVQTVGQDAASEAAAADGLRALYQARGYDLVASTKDTTHRTIEQRITQMSMLINLLTGMAAMTAIVGAIALSGTLSINVMERTREIGVMRAIGASSWVVSSQFIGEGLILGWLSWLLAIPLSLPAGQLLVRVLSGLMNMELVYRFSGTGVWSWLVIITLLATIASWFPAQKAAQMSVRESLAYL